MNDTSSKEDEEVKHKRQVMLRPVQTLFRWALDYHIYRLEARSTKYSRDVSCTIVKLVKYLNVQMKSFHFDPADPITILTFLPKFIWPCDSNGIHEVATVWMLLYFMRKTAGAALTAKPKSKNDKHATKDTLITFYPVAVNYLLRTHATDEIIAQALVEMNQFHQPDRMSAVNYAQALL